MLVVDAKVQFEKNLLPKWYISGWLGYWCSYSMLNAVNYGNDKLFLGWSKPTTFPYKKGIKPFQRIQNFKFNTIKLSSYRSKKFIPTKSRFRTLFGYIKPHVFVKSVRADFRGMYSIRNKCSGLSYIVKKTKMVFPETIHQYFWAPLAYYNLSLPRMSYWQVKKIFFHNTVYINGVHSVTDRPAKYTGNYLIYQFKWDIRLLPKLFKKWRHSQQLRRLRFLIFRHKILNQTTRKTYFNSLWDPFYFNMRTSKANTLHDWRCGLSVIFRKGNTTTTEQSHNWETFSTYNWKVIT